MNLLQIKQKMLEKAVSESYMADACGVSKLYLHQAVVGNISMTNKLLQKIENVFKTLEAGKLASENARKVNEEKLSDDVKKIRERKEQIGTSFSKIAEFAGYHPDYIYQIVSGKHVSKKAIKKIMAVLDKIENGLVVEGDNMQKSDQPVVTKEITDGGYVSDNGETLVKAEKHFPVGASVLVPLSEVPSNPLLSGIVNTAREYIKIFGNTIQDMEFELDNKQIHFVVEIKDKEAEQ